MIGNKRINFEFVFNKNNRLKKNNTAPIYLQVYIPNLKKQSWINTNICITPDSWDEKNKCININHPDVLEINEYLINIKKTLVKYQESLIQEKKILTLDHIKKIVKNLDISQNTDNFIDFMYNDLNENKKYKKSTIRSHRLGIKTIRKFMPYIPFDSISYELIRRFDNYLYSKNLSTNTIANRHKIFRYYINQAIKQKLLKRSSYPYELFSVKWEKKKKKDLSINEIDKIQAIEIPAIYKDMENVRNMFLFSCYTGLRFSDIQDLQKCHVNFENGAYSITKKMLKVEDQKEVFIPVSSIFNGKPEVILKKYLNNANDYIFPRMSNQHVNRLLKTIALMAGIDKILTFHMSRHTCGSLLANITGDPFLIRSILGHTDIKTSMNYIHDSKNNIIDKVKRIKWD